MAYGGQHTLYCGDSHHDIQPGDWYHDDIAIGKYRRSYTIANATFSDDGEYQCRRNGTNVFSLVYVHGKSYPMVGNFRGTKFSRIAPET